ncbi:hypothetical protein G9A89_017099 [Geosiphon pyriformis]|nr:hypothetical protein G9A89_017099 [Geosiphon pyriformis]
MPEPCKPFHIFSKILLIHKFLRYFSNNNSINRLATTFTTIKQRKNEAILNQFIRGLCSSILQCIHPMHLINLQAAVTNARDFEATELEANHIQAINLVMNGSSKLDSKLKQFKLLAYEAAAILSTTSILNVNLLTNDTSNLSATATTHLLATALGNISAPTNSNTATELTSKWNPKAEIDPTKLEIINGSSSTDLHLLVTPEDAQPNNPETNQHLTLTSNILPAIITKNKSLDTIFSFELEKPLTTPLFSGAALEKKPITVMYTDTKVDGHAIKLILDSRLAGSIIT